MKSNTELPPATDGPHVRYPHSDADQMFNYGQQFLDDLDRINDPTFNVMGLAEHQPKTPVASKQIEPTVSYEGSPADRVAEAKTAEQAKWNAFAHRNEQ